MALVNIDINFDIYDNNILNVDFYIPKFEFEEILNDTAFKIENRIYIFTNYRDTDIVYDGYSNNIFSVDYGSILFMDLSFNSFVIEYRTRSGLCGDVSSVSSYFFRAYHIVLGQYVFWTAGIKTFTQEITGYDPEHLQNITILFIKNQ